MSIFYVLGDATNPICRPAVIAHVCNDVGAWGKGFVKALSERWIEPEQVYRSMANCDALQLGTVQFVDVEDGLLVANMVGQHGIGRVGRPIRYDAVERALDSVRDYAGGSGSSVHMPFIGCGLAGGGWEDMRPVVERSLRGIDTYVYALTPDALAAAIVSY